MLLQCYIQYVMACACRQIAGFDLRMKLTRERWGSLLTVSEQQACYLGSYSNLIRDMRARNKSSMSTVDAKAWLLNHPEEVSPMFQVTAVTISQGSRLALHQLQTIIDIACLPKWRLQPVPRHAQVLAMQPYPSACK